jgi:hypothetical protein
MIYIVWADFDVVNGLNVSKIDHVHNVKETFSRCDKM